MTTRRNGATPDDVRQILTEQPLVSATRAAEILGIMVPNLARIRQAGKMPEPVPVEGRERRGAPRVYLKSEIEALARELAK